MKSSLLLCCFSVLFSFSALCQDTTRKLLPSADTIPTPAKPVASKDTVPVAHKDTIPAKPVAARDTTLTDTGGNKLAVTLEQVTVSYGKQLKRDITGSVSKVTASSVQDVTAAEFGQKLQGKVAGLQIQQTSGIPGQSIVFRIRGAASLNSGNQPLIVVDGQPINNDVAGGTGDVNLISPDEIESYSVLKDAAATSLYGSRASNGVILITTKTAKIDQTSVSANIYYGLQTVPQRGRPDLMNAREFATFMNGFYQDKITYESWVNPVTGTPSIPSDYANPAQYGKGTDWYGALIRTAPIENYSVNMSFGTGKVSSSTTMNYFNQQGVLYNTGTQRFAFRSPATTCLLPLSASATQLPAAGEDHG